MKRTPEEQHLHELIERVVERHVKPLRIEIDKLKEQLNTKPIKNNALPFIEGKSFDWDKFAKDLEEKFGECLISDDSGDENNPYDYWLQDVTVFDIVEFCKNYK